ncbi:hypothetical protein HOF65_04705 [bacterium]|nr:hypothetical protein [bacterium]MBT3853258.1 hypothetical protein [bacterium]MBT4632966.1 hypothetical protein [bacterium]MBT6778250.1 hypothetical protein [bacterium]
MFKSSAGFVASLHEYTVTITSVILSFNTILLSTDTTSSVQLELNI